MEKKCGFGMHIDSSREFIAKVCGQLKNLPKQQRMMKHVGQPQGVELTRTFTGFLLFDVVWIVELLVEMVFLKTVALDGCGHFRTVLIAIIKNQSVLNKD